MKRQEQLGPASPSTARRTRFRTRFSQTRNPNRHSQATRGITTLRERNESPCRLGEAAAGTQRVVMSVLSKGRYLKRPRVHTNHREGSRNEHLGGAQDPPQGLAMGIFTSSDRTRRWTCLVRSTRARERATGLYQQEQAPPDMMTGQSMPCMSASRSARWPEAHSQTQRRQLRRVATIELRRERAPEAEAEHENHVWHLVWFKMYVYGVVWCGARS